MTLEAIVDIAMTGDPHAPAAGDWVPVGLLVGATTKSGRQPGTNPIPKWEAGTGTLEVFDPTRALDPHNPTGPYAGKIDERRPVRIRARDTDLGYGPTQVWQGWLTDVVPVTVGHSGHRAQLTVVDPLGELAALPMPRTAMSVFVTQLALGQLPAFFAAKSAAGSLRPGWVQAFYPADEGVLAFGDTAGITDAGPNHWTNAYNNANTGQPPINSDASGNSWYTSGLPGATGNYILLPAGATIQVPFTLAFWLKVDAPRAGTAYRTVMAQYDGAGHCGVRVRVQDTGSSSPGEIVVDLDDGLGGPRTSYFRSDFLTGVAKRVDDGKPHYVVISYYATNTPTGFYELEVDGVLSLSSHGDYTGKTVVAAPAPANGYGTGYVLLGADSGGGTFFGAGTTSWLPGNFDDLLFVNAVIGTSPSPFYKATQGIIFEPAAGSNPTTQGTGSLDPSERVVPILAAAGWPTALLAMSAGTAPFNQSPTTGVQYSGQSALDLLNAAAVAEDGAVRPTKDGKVKFRGKNELPAAVSATWDDGTSGVAGALPYEDVALARSKVTNRWTVQRSGTIPPGVWWPTSPATAEDAASQARFGVRAATLDLPIIDQAQRAARGAALLARTKLPATRITSMVVNLMASTAHRDAVLGAELEDLWRVLYTPAGAGYTIDVTVRLVGVKHTVGRGTWRAELTLAPW